MTIIIGMLIGLILGAVLGVVKISYDRSYNHAVYILSPKDETRHIHEDNGATYYTVHPYFIWLPICVNDEWVIFKTMYHVAHFYEKGKELHDEKTSNEWKEYYLTERDMFWLTLKE